MKFDLQQLPPNGERIVFIHGFQPLIRKPYDMLGARLYMARRGYETLNIKYTPLDGSIAEIADAAWAKIKQAGFDAPDRPFHIIAHSMGGIVAHEMIARHNPTNLGRVVMWGTPLHGCEFADALNDSPLLGPIFKKLGGQPGQELQVKSDASFKDAKIGYEAGMIAGVSKLVPLSDIFIGEAGPHDGIVPLARTQHDGLKEHITLKISHVGMLMSPRVYLHTEHFLKSGCFTPS